MYGRAKPKWVGERISDELYEELMEVASMEAETFLSFGGPYECFERAVLGAARKVLDSLEKK